MTNPEGPKDGDGSAWSRPGEHEAPQPLPPDRPTTEYSTQFSGDQPPVQDYPDYPPAEPASAPVLPPPPVNPPPARERGGFLRDPISIVLVLVIVAALVIAGVVGAEIYARNRADNVVASVAKCLFEDDADVSFGAKPFLLQHFTKHYDDLTITTAGNNLRDAKGMKLQLKLDDITMSDSPDSRGTIGSLQATATWTTAGIQDSLKNIGGLGSFITISDVTTNAADGTIEIGAELFIVGGSIVAKPQVVNNELQLEVVDFTGAGLTLPSETVQPILDAFTSALVDDYPMGVQAQSVEVTDDGVISTFGAQNATIPRTDDPCFDALS